MMNSLIDIDSLDAFLKQKFSILFPEWMYEGYGDYESNKLDILYEIENYGLVTIGDLEKIIPGDYIDKIVKYKIRLNYLGTLRVILIIHDHEKYVKHYNEFSYINSWRIDSIKSIEELFDSYSISVDKIIGETAN